MSTWPAALALSVAGSAGGLLVASTLLLLHQDVRTRTVPWLVSYAVGTLLGAALLGLVPEALSSLEPPQALGALLAGIVTFFVLEKAVLWRHCHDEGTCTIHRSTVTLIVLGDAVHTFVDGVVIAAAVQAAAFARKLRRDCPVDMVTIPFRAGGGSGKGVPAPPGRHYEPCADARDTSPRDSACPPTGAAGR